MSQQNQPQNQPKEPLLKLTNTDDYRDGYANSVQVRMSVWDFFLVFGTMTQQNPDELNVKNFQGIYLSPQQAKALWNVLGHNLAQYEQTFGSITLEQLAALVKPRLKQVQYRTDLPQGIIEPQVSRVQVAGGPIAFFGVTTTALSEQELSWFIDNAVTKRLLALPGVSQASRVGGVDRQMRVDLDPARMQALGLTAAQVNDQLRDLNLNAPGGRAQVGGGEQTIRVLGSARSALNLAPSWQAMSFTMSRH